MKIIAKQTGEFLNNPASVAGTLVYGPDDGLVLRHSRHIIQRILGNAYDPLSLIELTDQSLKDDPSRLADECGAMSLMGGNRLVWLRGISEKYASLVEPCLSRLDASCYLLVSDGELGPRHKLRQLFEQHKMLASLACYRAEGRQLSQLIRDILAGYGQQVDSAGMQLLMAELGNDAMITESELAKLSLYAHGKETISHKDVQAAIIHNQEHQLDPLAHFFVEQKAAEFDTLWHHLIRDGQPPIMLIRSLARYVQRLLTLRLIMQQEGISAEEAVNQARPPVFWNQKDSMIRQLKRLTGRHLVYYLHLLNQAETAFKLHSYAGDMAPQRVLLRAMHKIPA